MGAMGQSALLHAWTCKGPLARLLWPISQLYGALVALRRQLFLKGILRSQRAQAFVIVVGNVVAGGPAKRLPSSPWCNTCVPMATKWVWYPRAMAAKPQTAVK